MRTSDPPEQQPRLWDPLTSKPGFSSDNPCSPLQREQPDSRRDQAKAQDGSRTRSPRQPVGITASVHPRVSSRGFGGPPTRSSVMPYSTSPEVLETATSAHGSTTSNCGSTARTIPRRAHTRLHLDSHHHPALLARSTSLRPHRHGALQRLQIGGDLTWAPEIGKSLYRHGGMPVLHDAIRDELGSLGVSTRRVTDQESAERIRRSSRSLLHRRRLAFEGPSRQVPRYCTHPSRDRLAK